MSSAFLLLCATVLLLVVFVSAERDDNKSSVQTTTSGGGPPSTADICALVFSTEQTYPKTYEWCAADDACAALFHQKHHGDAQLFRFQLERIIGSETPMSAVTRWLCTKQSAEDVVKALWLIDIQVRELMAGQLCAPGTNPFRDPKTGLLQCVCEPDQQCFQEPPANMTLYTILLAVVVLIVIGLCAQFCSTASMADKLSHYT